MLGIVRRVVIFAAVDGLILQAHGPIDHHKLLQIDYRSNKVVSCPAASLPRDNEFVSLESHGILGLFSIFSSSYLIAVSKREQVAQLFGRPIYVIRDVAIVPLNSQQDAARALRNAAVSNHDHTNDSSDSDSDMQPDEGRGKLDFEPSNGASDPPDSSSPPKAAPSSRIAEEVFTKRGQYGRFASQWFSRRGWGPEMKPEEGLGAKLADSRIEGASQSTTTAADGQWSEPSQASRITSGPDQGEESIPEVPEAPKAFLPKVLKTTKLLLSSGCFYFSYDYDLTTRLSVSSSLPSADSQPDPMYIWNARLGTPFSKGASPQFCLPILQGFVGQRSFRVKRDTSNKDRSHSVVSQPLDLTETVPADKTEPAPISTTSNAADEQSFIVTVISRRSVKRAGLRYLRRGIDDEGNCANFVETEQILTSDPWTDIPKVRSFVQVRGSIPLYFSQTPYAFKPIPVLHQSESLNQAAYKKHFKYLQDQYGDIQISLLVDKHGGESGIGEAYEKATKTANAGDEFDKLSFDWFDFHHECRGMKFENVQLLVDKLGQTIQSHGETTFEFGKLTNKQRGVIRVNCMDCLDRTNVVQSAFGQYVLQRDLQDMGYGIDLVHDQSTQWFNTLWADNGDSISKAYAGSSALKGDYTRTRKRNYRGALNDLGLTLTRYYNNIVNDYFAQAVIDFLLGNVSSRVFEDFENTMMSSDPGISISKIRETAIDTCSKIVVQDSSEDLIHGWTMLSPAQPSTLRSLPFEERVVLLTNAAVYCCKFDWNTEKVAAFEKIDLRSVTKIKYGTYVTSTLTPQETDDTANAGLVVTYKPGKGSTIRVNTRSLSSAIPEGPQEVDGGTGVLSWLKPHDSGEAERFLALKVIGRSAEEKQSGKSGQTPLQLAEDIASEIRRAALAGVAVVEALGDGKRADKQEQKQKQEDKGLMVQGTIISLAEARQRTSYLEYAQHSLKKLVWT